jgi:hypothetical protein
MSMLDGQVNRRLRQFVRWNVQRVGAASGINLTLR